MSKPMNIVLLMTDQWRWDTLFDPKSPCKTPNLDAFAAESQVFPRAYTCYPLCCPARGSLFTGKLPHQHNLMDNIGGGSYYPHGKLHRSHVTYLERLRDDAGYAIAYAGKWHLGTGTLIERGIGNALATDGGDGRRGWGQEWRRSALDPGAHPDYYGAFEKGVSMDEVQVRSGIEQLRGLAGQEKPFCAVISTHGPHFPHHVPKRFADMYDGLPADFVPGNYCPPFTEPNKPLMQSRGYWPCQHTSGVTPEQWRKTCQHYWAYCTYLDELMGEVLGELDALGLRDNTVVAFTADHGEKLGAHGHFDKGPDFYEETMHIPMMVRDPLSRAPEDGDGFVNLRDLFPTLIGLAGEGGILSEDEHARSFWATSYDHTFYCYDAYQGREFKLRGIHTRHYKYNWSPHDLCELYDLETDPGERVNLIDSPEHQDVVDELHGRLTAWMEREGDYLLHAKHLLPPGAYIDGRDVSEQHDHQTGR